MTQNCHFAINLLQIHQPGNGNLLIVLSLKIRVKKLKEDILRCFCF